MVASPWRISKWSATAVPDWRQGWVCCGSDQLAVEVDLMCHPETVNKNPWKISSGYVKIAIENGHL